ncbi:hypothetical protein MTO96_012796 [Rhipicephalus appendiculatus]
MTGAADDQCCLEASPTGLHRGVSRDGASSRLVTWLLVSVLFVLCVLAAENRVDARHFTADELLRTKFPMRVSDDLDLDPCKSETVSSPSAERLFLGSRVLEPDERFYLETRAHLPLHEIESRNAKPWLEHVCVLSSAH